MPGKAGEILRWIIGAKVIEQKKRIELWDLVITESSLKMNAGALYSGLTL